MSDVRVSEGVGGGRPGGVMAARPLGVVSEWVRVCVTIGEQSVGEWVSKWVVQHTEIYELSHYHTVTRSGQFRSCVCELWVSEWVSEWVGISELWREKKETITLMGGNQKKRERIINDRKKKKAHIIHKNRLKL